MKSSSTSILSEENIISFFFFFLCYIKPDPRREIEFFFHSGFLQNIYSSSEERTATPFGNSSPLLLNRTHTHTSGEHVIFFTSRFYYYFFLHDNPNAERLPTGMWPSVDFRSADERSSERRYWWVDIDVGVEGIIRERTPRVESNGTKWFTARRGASSADGNTTTLARPQCPGSKSGILFDRPRLRYPR